MNRNPNRRSKQGTYWECNWSFRKNVFCWRSKESLWKRNQSWQIWHTNIMLPNSLFFTLNMFSDVYTLFPQSNANLSCAGDKKLVSWPLSWLQIILLHPHHTLYRQRAQNLNPIYYTWDKLQTSINSMHPILNDRTKLWTKLEQWFNITRHRPSTPWKRSVMFHCRYPAKGESSRY